MQTLINNIVVSSTFKKQLNKINVNYSNIKQEAVIRNAVLEQLNEHFLKTEMSFKAFGEHPREKGCRVDLSIVDKSNLNKPFLIEFKFQYTDDFSSFTQYKNILDRDFQRSICQQSTNLFILIVANWTCDDKVRFDKEWGITSNLSRFLCTPTMNEWKHNISQLLSNYTEAEVQEANIEVDEPYKTTYHFYLL